jgi:glycosyltransferase involved in cell wall biosynthesis
MFNDALPVIFVVFQTARRANGGVESITQVLERVQCIKPIVVTQIETAMNHRWRDAGADVHVWQLPFHMGSSFRRSDFSIKLRRIWSLACTNYWMWQLVRATGCRIVHCNDILSLWHTALGARSAGASIVQSIRGVKEAHERYGWHWQLALWLSHRQLVNSQEMRAALTERLNGTQQPKQFRRAAISCIYSMINFNHMRPADLAARDKLRHRLGIGPDTFAVGFIATFSALKAQCAFIEAAGPLMRAAVPACRVYFLGDFNPEDSDYARACMHAVQRLGLESIMHFIGFTANVADWYRALDIVVVVSRREGLARCMTESLACGTPVVSFDVCSAREILEQYDCGRVVSQGDYAGLVRELVALAGNPCLRNALGTNGSRKARELFHPESIIEQYERLYRDLARETHN